MYIAPGQGQTTPGDKFFMSTETCCHFGHLLHVSNKISLKSDFIHFFFMILYMYIAPGQGLTTPWDEILMSTGTSCHFGHLLQVSTKSLRSLILYNFFMILYMYIDLRQGRQPPGCKSFMSTERPCHFTHLLQVSKKALSSLI